MSCSRRADDGMAQLGGLSLQKGEILKMLSVLPLRCLPRQTLRCELVLKEDDFSCKALSYPIFMTKPSTHRMHDPGSIVPHIRPKVFTDNQMSRIKYNYYYINSISKDYDDS
jgi:hypothetical protein